MHPLLLNSVGSSSFFSVKMNLSACARKIYASQPNLRAFKSIWKDNSADGAEKMEAQDVLAVANSDKFVYYKVSFTASLNSLKRMCYISCSEASYLGLKLLSDYDVANGVCGDEVYAVKDPCVPLQECDLSDFLSAFQFLLELSANAMVNHSFLKDPKIARKWLLVKQAIQYWTATTVLKYRKDIIQGEVRDADKRLSLTRDVAQGVQKLLRQLIDIYPEVLYILTAVIDCAWRAEYYNSFYHNLHACASLKYFKLLCVLIDSTESRKPLWTDKRLIKKTKNITVFRECFISDGWISHRDAEELLSSP